MQRFSRLVKLLNAMSESFYDMSPIDGEEGRTFSPGALSNVTINEDWLRAQIRFDYLIKTAQKTMNNLKRVQLFFGARFRFFFR